MTRYIFLTCFLISFSNYSQEALLKGRIIDINSTEMIPEVNVTIQNSPYSALTNEGGLFTIISDKLPQGEQVLLVSKTGYFTQRILVSIQNGKTINLDPILLVQDLSENESQIGIVSLSDNELDLEDGSSIFISGLLSASKDLFLNAASYDFSATFFRPRGLDNAYGKILINGIEMNKQYNGRPQWADWGGLNDAQHNIDFSMGLKANDFNFGDIAGNTSIVMRASRYRKGGRISFAFSNKTYRGRVMASYSSGLSLKGWAYSFLVARRYGEEGYLEGTLYDSNSFFGSVEKKLSNTHQLNFTAFYAPNRRALATALTQEVRDLKGIRYNPNWGYQDSEKRSSRVREINEPMILLNHYWNFSAKTSLNTNLGVQVGKIGNSRLDYGSNRNPAGNYYQRLPSYFLREKNPTIYDYQQAYLAEQEFINNGQIEWNSLYAGNASSDNAAYTIQDDRVDDTQFTINTIFNTRFSKGIFLSGNINYRNLKSENFAELKDLLGGKGYLDIDSFGLGGVESNSDLQNVNRVVQEGERYKYNYNLTASVVSGFLQAKKITRKIDYYVALSASASNYKRIGFYQNGYFPEIGRSLGEGEPLNFMNFGCKLGATYKITGRHLMDLNVGYFTKAPTLQSSFANVRQNNDIVFGIKNEGIISADVGYICRTPILKARFTGYYSSIKNQIEVGVFFTENALGNEEINAFVNEIVTDIEKVSIGVEIGVEAQVLPTFKLKAAISEGHNMYARNPNLYLAGDDFGMEGNDISTQGIRSVILKNYHVASGPERAIQLGFEYSDLNFWWFGATVNYFANSYIDVSNLRRTNDFFTDIDGQPFNDYDQDIARELLQQEKFDDYFLVNVVGGKSWAIKNYRVGFFATVNNILNQNFVAGGFEDSRRSSYRQQVEEQSRDTPMFGNRYFFGNGTTYYTSVYIQF